MSVKTPAVSVVIPCYNEKDNIAEAVSRTAAIFGEALHEIIVVDDDSPDRTWEVAGALPEPRCRVVRRIGKRGLASALADGTKMATGDAVVWLDCDLVIPPEDVRRLVEKLDAFDVAVASRYVPGGGDDRHWFRVFLSYLLNFYARVVLWRDFWDWTSGIAAVRRETLAKVPLSEEGYGDYFIDWIYRCLNSGARVVEAPYHLRNTRTSGVSKTDGELGKFLSLGFSYAFRVIKVRFGS